MTFGRVAEALPPAIRLVGWPKLVIFFFFFFLRHLTWTLKGAFRSCVTEQNRAPLILDPLPVVCLNCLADNSSYCHLVRSSESADLPLVTL